jgi:hypothetical protein
MEHNMASHDSSSKEKELFRKERLEIHKLLDSNPNYFGTVPDANLPVVQQIEFNTSYEELTCVGLWPEKNLLEATISVKLPFGFLGDMCSPGSTEYVRFFIDWNDDGDFSDFNEDAGLTSVNVHDIPQVKKHKLCYAVRQEFKPFLAGCKEPYIVKLRAILSWEFPPTGPNFIPIWGNVLECWIQIDPVRGRIVGVVDDPKAKQAEPAAAASRQEAERERVEFLALVNKNPNFFGTLAGSTLKPVKLMKFNTRYEELKCIGLYPEENFLEAILEVKLPYGFLGDLCTQGSREYVRFFIDWNGDGDFVDFNEDAGIASVNVHDIPEVRRVHLCYALGKRFRALRASCQKPYIVKVRAILSWQQPPTGPNFIPVWGNIVECWVQIKPTEDKPKELTGIIDSPLANACVAPIVVPACIFGGGPLTGIEITGTAAGGPFDHYTLRYSWDASAPGNAAVVYPDCSRPPGSVSSNVPVVNGVLGYLDLTLLPPGVGDFTIYLDVYGTPGHVAVTRTFKLKTTAVEISAAATVNALVAEDPFHLTTFPKLIKATNDPSPTVPELSIGGLFSVDGSAYIIGCDRIMSQFSLVNFAAPPAAPVPNFPNATGGSPLIVPVVYADIPGHPWQSGCIGVITPNVILNGNLVANWSVNHCVFLGIPYTVPKVKPKPNWDSTALNGRYVLLVEVRDRLDPGGAFPGVFAAKDQVVVWLDNQNVSAAINSIGGIHGCGDLHLKDFVGSTCEIRGVAWDPPIDPTAPQQTPNDNYGFHSLSFQKNGGGGGSIPPATPGVRVPNIWPGPLVPADEGTLADWDIVGALDFGGPGPVPAGSGMLARGERCAYIIGLHVEDTTHVGDGGGHHHLDPLYAINIINDI